MKTYIDPSSMKEYIVDDAQEQAAAVAGGTARPIDPGVLEAQSSGYGAGEMPILDPRQSREALGGMVRYGAPLLTGGASIPIQAGAMAGMELAAQAIGGEETDPWQAVFAGALSPLGAGVARVGKAVFRGAVSLIPGTAQWFHEVAHTTMMGTVDEMAASVMSVDRAFDLASLLGKGVKAQVKPLLRAITETRVDEEILKKLGAQSKAVLTRLDKLEAGVVGEASDLGLLPVNEVNVLRKRIGEWVRATKVKGGPVHGVYKKLYEGIMEGIEDSVAAGQAGNLRAAAAIGSLKQALAVTKMHKGLEELTDVVASKVLKPTSDGLLQVDAKALHQALRLNKEIQKIGPHRLGRLKVMADEMSKLPKLESSQGMLVAAGISAGAGATIGGLTGAGAPGVVAGGAIGALAGPKILRAAADRISRMMLTESGRVGLAALFKETKGTLNRDALVALFNMGRATLADMADDETQTHQTIKDRPQTIRDWERIGFDFKKGSR